MSIRGFFPLFRLAPISARLGSPESLLCSSFLDSASWRGMTLACQPPVFDVVVSSLFLSEGGLLCFFVLDSASWHGMTSVCLPALDAADSKGGRSEVVSYPCTGKTEAARTVTFLPLLWGARWDSNPRPSEPQSDALTN